jgi:hypothetical protein
MPSTYSPSLGIELIGNGEQASNWGNTTNYNLGTLLEQAITGVGNVTMAGPSVTIVTGTGVVGDARNAVLVLGGTLSATCNLIVPSVNKFYAIRNATAGGQAVIVKTSAGTGVTLFNGYTQLVYCDGTNVVSATIPTNSSNGDAVITGNLINYNNITMQNATLTSGTYYSPILTSSPGSFQTYLRYFHQPDVSAGAQIVVGSSSVIFRFENNGNGYAPNTFISLSDRRVKDEQKIIEGALNKVNQLNGITYKRNDISNIDGSPIVNAGLLAQDVAAVLPEAVDVASEAPANDPDGPGLMSLNYNGVIALLVNAVKELSAKVDALEKKAAG